MFAELEEVIQREMERGRIPGLAISLVKGQEVVWSRGYGYADLEKKVAVTPSTVFSAQSVTKPVVATALMQWHERSRFKLDDLVNDHLAPIRLPNEWEDTSPVTIRHLLTHTGGLPVDVGAAESPPASELPLEEFVATVPRTVRPPGGEMVYANWGYSILGYLLGRFAAQSYDEYLRAHVFEPLGMQSSAIGHPPEGTAVATGYFLSVIDGQHYAPPPLTWRTRPADPAGALYSSVEDLARFLIAHLNDGAWQGRRILAGRTVADMHRLQVQAGRSQGGMGLGFKVDRQNGKRLICHGGDGPTFTAFVGAHPEEKVGVALLINMGRAQTTRSVVAGAALRSLLGDDRRFGSQDVGQGASALETAVPGRYVSNFWGVEANVRLDGGLPAVDVQGGIVASIEGERSYLIRGEDGALCGYDGPFDGFDVTFEPGAGGETARFYGGLYPWRFDRQGDVMPLLPVDEEADLKGRWIGTIDSPLGPVPVRLYVADGSRATVTALAAQDAALVESRAERGRVSGYLDTSLPAFGEFRVFFRLAAVGEGLRGRVYARGDFGEVPMPVELSRSAS